MDFTPFQDRCIELLKTGTCRGRHSLRGAVNHLRKAWALRTTDAEMAIFRAITAEEEAATGLIYALQYRKYNNAEQLDPWNHKHKSAVTPFLQVLGFFFSEFTKFYEVKPILHLQNEGEEKRLMIALPMALNGVEKWAYPRPPLNFSVHSGGLPISYKAQLEKFLTDQNASSMTSYVREVANLRNRILYAGVDGYPVIDNVQDGFFVVRRARVVAMLTAYLLIEPYEELQPFVQNALDAYLVMLGKMPDANLHPEI